MVAYATATEDGRESITLATNQVFVLLTWRARATVNTYMFFQESDGTQIDQRNFRDWVQEENRSNNPYQYNQIGKTDQEIFVGPGKVELLVNKGNVGYRSRMTYQIITLPTEESTVPSTSVVVPADNAGPVEIKLEQSEDLINWTAASPGEYGTSTTKRFFRVRAVRK